MVLNMCCIIKLIVWFTPDNHNVYILQTRCTYWTPYVTHLDILHLDVTPCWLLYSNHSLLINTGSKRFTWLHYRVPVLGGDRSEWATGQFECMRHRPHTWPSPLFDCVPLELPYPVWCLCQTFNYIIWYPHYNYHNRLLLINSGWYWRASWLRGCPVGLGCMTAWMQAPSTPAGADILPVHPPPQNYLDIMWYHHLISTSVVNSSLKNTE
jgi:hypothetical protein